MIGMFCGYPQRVITLPINRWIAEFIAAENPNGGVGVATTGGAFGTLTKDLRADPTQATLLESYATSGGYFSTIIQASADFLLNNNLGTASGQDVQTVCDIYIADITSGLALKKTMLNTSVPFYRATSTHVRAVITPFLSPSEVPLYVAGRKYRLDVTVRKP